MLFDEKSAITELDADALELMEEVSVEVGDRLGETDDEDEADEGFARRGTPATVVASTSPRLLEAESKRARWSELERAGGSGANRGDADEGWGLGPTRPEIADLSSRAEASIALENEPPPESNASATSSPRQPTLLGLPLANLQPPVPTPRTALRALPSLRLPGSAGPVGRARAGSERSLSAVSSTATAATRTGSAATGSRATVRGWGFGLMGYVIVGLAGLLGVAIGLLIRSQGPPAPPPTTVLDPIEITPGGGY